MLLLSRNALARTGVAIMVATGACDRPRPAPHADTAATRPAPDTVTRFVYRVRRQASAMQRVTGVLNVHRALAPLDSTLAVRVLDARGAAFAGAAVAWSADTADGARLRVLNGITDRGGISRARFVPGRRAAAQHVFARVARVGRIDFSVTVPAASIRVAPAALTLWSGDSAALGFDARDSAGAPLRAGEAGWGSTDTAVVRVRPGPAATTIANGGLAGAAKVVAWLGDARDTITVVVRPVVDVRFVTLDSSPAPLLAVEVVSGSRLDSATVTSGHYHRRIENIGDDVEIRARALDTAAAYQRIAVRVQEPRDLQSLTIALVPVAWRITAGTWAGRVVPIDAGAAMQRGAADAPFWRLAPISGRGPRTLLGWATSQRPLHLAFDRSSGGAISAADSIAFWSIAGQMERDVGHDLFAPAQMADTARMQVIPVQVRPQQPEGHTFVTWGAAGDATDGTVRFRGEATLRAPGVVTHELLHLIGFGHTLSWPSVARPVSGSAPGLTVEDVAYVQLAMRLREFQRATGARPGLPVARQ